MRRAFQLAKLGAAKVAPNPLVGCLIIHPEKGLIGEGWHRAYGEAHAEVNALASVENPRLIPGCTAIVNLEPCAHFGKTPPCADLLIEKGIGEVIICNTDPNPLVAGKGSERLRRAGIRVETGILEAEGRELNRFFFTAQEKKRPYITLKWARSADGFMAGKNGTQVWISSPESRLLVHSMRAEHQAIFAGRNTLRLDNPLLNLRQWPGRQPVRLVCDPNLQLPPELRVFTDASAPTWILNQQKESSEGHLRFLKLEHADDLSQMLEILWKEGIHSVLVEGGAEILGRFLDSGVWDRALVFSGRKKLDKGIAAPEPPGLYLLRESSCGPDQISLFSKES